MDLARGTQTFQKSSSNLKIPGPRVVTWSKFHTENPTDIRRHGAKFSPPYKLVPGICAPFSLALREKQGSFFLILQSEAVYR